MSDPTPDRAGMPRWVKVSLMVVGALIVLFVALNLIGMGGNHGPGRHTGMGVAEAPFSVAPDDGR